MIDLNARRLEISKTFLATAIISPADGHAAEEIMKITGGRGVDCAIDAVRAPDASVICENIVAAGVNIHLERLWSLKL